MAEICRENRHNPIKSQMVCVRLSGPDFRLPDKGEANRMSWVLAADLSVLENRPVADVIGLDECGGRNLW